MEKVAVIFICLNILSLCKIKMDKILYGKKQKIKRRI